VSSTRPANPSVLDSTTFRFVLLISLAHALVHVFELSLSSVEQLIGDEFSVGKQWTGMLGTAFRLPFGLGAVLAGYLADRFGARRLLCVFLFGSMAVGMAMPLATTRIQVMTAMIMLGCFASIYHPAGLSLLSRVSTPANRGRALGLHGICGSLGICGAPLLAGLVLSASDGDWKVLYVVLGVPAAVVGILLLRSRSKTPAPKAVSHSDDATTLNWNRYLIAIIASGTSGIVYGAFLHFLPRYLDDSNLLSFVPRESARNYLTAAALLFGVAGQWIAGRMAKPGRLEIQFLCILLGNAPFLFWMAIAQDEWRLVAACLFALVHFMNQPVYNSLLATIVPARNRSIGYGFSNMIGFGVGAFGPAIAGQTHSDQLTYTTLGCISLVSSVLAIPLILSRSTSNGTKKSTGRAN
jgi:FSR family fosmidomycin resistance protein-like MFS transporter